MAHPSKTIVVVDVPILRLVAVGAVEDAGFKAIEAREADEAVRPDRLYRPSILPGIWMSVSKGYRH
jgi:hypothetical protein